MVFTGGMRIGRAVVFSALCVVGLVARGRAATSPVIRWQAGGHGQGVAGVAYSPDGQYLASASGDNTAKVWERATGRLVHTFAPPFQSGVHSVQFTPDSADLIGTSTGGGYRWRLSDGALVAEYCCLETGYASALSPDGTLVAIGGSESGSEEATLLMTLDGQPVRLFKRLVQHYVFAVVFTPDGSHVITGSGSVFASGTLGVIRWWRISDGAETRTVNAHTKRVNALALSPDGTLLVSASLDANVKIWDAATGDFIRTLSGHTVSVTGLAFAPGGDELATSGGDGTVRIWNPQTGALLRTLTGHSGSVGGVAWSADGGELLTSGGGVFVSTGDATVRTWTAAGAPLANLTQLTSRAEGLAATADGTRVAIGSYNHANVYDAHAGTLLRSIPFAWIGNEVALTSDGAIVATGAYDGTVHLWRVSDGALLHTLPGHSSYIVALAISPDDQHVLASDWDGPTRVWRVDTGEFVTEFPIGSRALGFAGDGTWFAAAVGNTVQLRAFPGGGLLRTLTGHTQTVNAIDVAHAGDRVISGSVDRSARIWDAATGAVVHVLSGHGHWVEAVGLSRDGRFAATGSAYHDVTLRLWDAATGGLLEAYDGETGSGVVGLAFLADNHGVAYGRLDAAIVVAENPFSVTVGDLDCDGALGFGDINPFVLAVLGEAGYLAAYPACNWLNGDIDGNGQVDFGDINPFVGLLAGR